MIEYKVVETSTITEDQMEKIINEWVEREWSFDGIYYAMRKLI